MKSRVEYFGAWILVDDGTLVAVDRPLARSLGVDGDALWNLRSPPPPAPLEAHVAVTSRCPVACQGCYQDAGPSGSHVSLDSLTRTLDALAQRGVFTVAFGGGEPLTRDDLATLAARARERGMVPVFTTSGIGLRDEHLRALAGFAQVNVSHDGVHGAYRSARGFDGASVAERAIAALVARSIPVGVNLVLTRSTFAHVEATADRVRALGARELQLLRYKPAGRAKLDYLAQRLTRAQALEVGPLLERLVARHRDALSIRVDCALVPFVAAHGFDAQTLERWGIFGCEAGRHLAAVDREGHLAPCSFAPATSSDRLDRWGEDETLEAFRAFAASPPEPCASCQARAACRGGCKVVSAHLLSDAHMFSSDPECPRVIAHRERAP
jgi:radical SAM protein with 4Fe4S-binding SPASM domain